MAIGEGRKRIIIEKEINKETLIEVVSEAMAIHQDNVKDFKYLINYYKGKQDILKRSSESAGYNSSINNTTVVNYAYSSVRDIVGYLFSKKTEYVCKDMKYREQVEKVSNVFNYENGALVDHEAATFAGITGMSYLFTLPSKELLSDYMPDIPIVNYAPDIMTTFVVQSAKMGNPVTLGVTYYTDKKNTYYTCYTDDKIYKFVSKGYWSFNINSRDISEITEEINPIGLIPIIQVKNNQFMQGDFEVAISVLNAINQLASDTLNDIENVIKSLLVVVGAEITGDVVDKVKKNRILNLFAEGEGSGDKFDAKFIYQQLDAMGMQNIRDYLEEAYKQIIGIPDRKTRGGGGGDTGDAVKLRDGWADIEIVARVKEQYFISSKMKQVALIVRIMKKLGMLDKDFYSMYMDIKLPRNTTDNLQTKAQAYSTLNGTKTLTPADAMDIVGLTTNIDQKMKKGEEYWDKKAEKQAELKSKSSENKLELGQQQKNQYNTDIVETKERKDVIKAEAGEQKRGRIY